MSRLWDKGKSLDDLVLEFTVGDDYIFDNRLVEHDIVASIAHAGMLKSLGYLTEDEFGKIESGLMQVGKAHMEGGWLIDREEEDAHTAIENRLIGIIGPLGKKVHLARSRNDQVLAALRLYLRSEVESLSANAHTVVESLERIASNQGEVVLPGFTHMQQAMPSSVELWAMGFATEILDDIAGLQRTLARINLNPLGSVAGFGPGSLRIDRAHTTQSLGFDRPQEPVTSVQLSRGKAEASLIFETSLLLNDLGRIAADLVLYATSEFGFVEMDDSITTGSSVMPQKRNPDIFELVRARSGQIQAWLSESLGVINKMSSGYHRDMQIIKEPLFRSIDLAHQVCQVMAHSLGKVRFVESRIRIDKSIYAAELAYRLVVEESISFRDAYRRIAEERPWEKAD